MLHFRIKLNQEQEPESSRETPPFFTIESLVKDLQVVLCVHPFCTFFCRDLPSRTNSESLPFYCELCSSAVSCFLALPGSADAGSLRNAPSLPLPAPAPAPWKGNKWTLSPNRVRSCEEAHIRPHAGPTLRRDEHPAALCNVPVMAEKEKQRSYSDQVFRL